MASHACPVCALPPTSAPQRGALPRQPTECRRCGWHYCASCGGEWVISETLTHRALTCAEYSERVASAMPPAAAPECPICLEQAPLVRWGRGCEHTMCALCCVRQVRNELAPTRTSIGCPYDGVCISGETLAAVAAFVPPGDSGERALAAEEVARAEFRVAVAAAGARGRLLVPCPACFAPLTPAGGPVTMATCRGRGGRPCDTVVCESCALPWFGAGDLRHDAFPTCAAFKEALRRVDAAAAAAATAAAAGGTDADADAATFKQCPVCGEGISHYRGHACHHIAPGRGCPTCASRGVTTHFCFVCLGPWPCAGPGGNGCRPYCDAACDCPMCPDCRPGRPCDHCSGPDSGCRACAPPASEEAAAAWLARCAGERAARMAAGWVGPRAGVRWGGAAASSSAAAAPAGALPPRPPPPPAAAAAATGAGAGAPSAPPLPSAPPGRAPAAAAVAVAVAATAEPDTAVGAALRALELAAAVPTPGTPPAAVAAAVATVIGALHALTVRLTAAIAAGQRVDACVAPLVAALQPFTTAAVSALAAPAAAAAAGPDPLLEALAETVFGAAEALAADAPLVRAFAAAGGPSLLLSLYHGVGATIHHRALGVIYASTRVAMAGGVDLPPQAADAFDAGDGTTVLLRMLAAAHAAGDAAARGQVLGALAGIRMHLPCRWAALRAAGGPGALLEPLLAVAAHPTGLFLPTAIIALARALVGLKQGGWTDADSHALDAAVERAASAAATQRATPLSALRPRLGALLSLPAGRLEWEQALLAGAISRLRAEAYTWLGGPVCQGWVALADALPTPPASLLARAALFRFHPGSLQRAESGGGSGGWGYQFGDGTRYVLKRLSSALEAGAVSAPPLAAPRGYQFGDLTRSLLGSLWGAPPASGGAAAAAASTGTSEGTGSPQSAGAGLPGSSPAAARQRQPGPAFHGLFDEHLHVDDPGPPLPPSAPPPPP